jgi:ketosteroid isomerase-like protein
MEIVRHYFDGLRQGRTVDALDVFATDAVLRDEGGVEHRGIREIVAALGRERHPVSVDLLSLHQEGDRVTALVEIRARGARSPTRSRQVFEIHGGRIRSLRREPIRPIRPRHRRASDPPGLPMSGA